MGCNCGKKKYETKVIKGEEPKIIQLPIEELNINDNGTGTTGETEQSQTGVQGQPTN